ncbi:MAG: CopG family transcriptional regulator [Proteobacteria bacterium]|nr:CopG family transcriptional regulator [Pseudomonadota bacterium]MBU1057188.1 CopG family transcriptional regulator [Pseudomonadota bacterium]
MEKKRERVFSFKADGDLAEALENTPNRSEFIRKALLTTLEHECPLCKGSGVLTLEQGKHLEQFLTVHPLTRCEECQAMHFVCHSDGSAEGGHPDLEKRELL